MANDEYNQTGGEFNKPIGEMNSGLGAMEYYPVKETAANGAEFLADNDNSASNQSDNGTSEQSAVDKYNETKNNLDNLNQASRNTADGVKSPDLNLANASEAEAEAAVASTAASVSVTSTVASLAGSVTVIAAAAAAVVSVAGGVLEKEPTILSEDYEVGTNYIKYEINLSELSENMDYKIKVSKPGFEIEYPILEEGLQRQIVPDLLPYRKYTLELIGVSPELGDIVYHTVECYTDILRMPKAVFQFTPHFDYILGRIDLEYETYISDFYNNSSNTYLQIYSGNKLILEDKTLPDDNFFRGTIHNLSSTSPIKAVAYTDWFNGLFTTENAEIGVYGYDIPIPDDFELKNLFMGSYTFGEECFYKTFDIENGTNLRIDTNFESDDEKESYRIDVYNHDEIIKSVESNEKTVDINLDTYVTNVDLKFTPLRIDGDDKKEFEPTIIKNYDVNPKIFEYANFYQYEGGYYFESLVSDDFVEKLSEKPLKMKVVRNFKDGTKVETAEELRFEEARISFEGSISDDQEKRLSDLSSFDVEITYGDTIITKFNSPTLADLSLGSADVDDDGNIIIPFEMSGIEALNDLKIRAMIAEEEYDSILEGNKGKIVASELNDNIVNVSMEVSHYSDGVTLISNLYVDDYDLGADYEVSYFVSHSGSYYTSFDIKYDASINGKNANINLYPVVYDNGKNEINYDDKYLDYYRFRYSESNDTVYFTIGNRGFTDTEHEVPIDVSAPMNIVNLNYFDLGYYDDESYEVYATYEKTYNADGTVNYIFDAPFSDPSDTHSVRIEGSYIVDGVEKYICSDFLTSDFKLTNIPDYDYDFVLRAYYKNGDILYDTTIHNWTDSCSLRDYKEAIINKSTYIGALISDENNPTLDRVIDLKLYTKNIDTSKGLTISYGGKDYQIVLDHNESDYVVSETDDDIEKRYNEIKTDYGYTIIYYNENENSYDKLKVELFIINGGKQDLDLNATATYYVSNGSESSKQEVKLINNTISYDKESLTYEYSSDEYYHIFNFNTKFDVKDERDDLKVVAYSNGREIGSSLLSEREFRIDKGYSDVTLKLQEVKRQYCDSINYNSHQGVEYIIFKEIELEKPELEAPASIINSINVENPDYGDEYIINVNADDFTDCSLNLYINYIDKDGNPYSDHVYGDNESTSVSFTKLENYTIKSVEVQVLKNWFTVNTFMVPLSVNLGETTVDEEITVPYSIDLPEGASLTSNAEYRVDGNSNSITSANGVLTIPSIEYKTEQIGFTLEYEYNGVTVYIPLRTDYTFEVEYEYDYSISAYYSSEYNFTNSVFINDDEGTVGHYVYMVDVDVKPKIGNIYLDSFNDYEVKITNAGKEESNSGLASIKADEQTLNGYEFKEHGRFLMYHEITATSYYPDSIDNCIFEFEIDGTAYKIEYVPTTIKSLNEVLSLPSIADINDGITKNGDKITISFDTGFDKISNPNYAYVVKISSKDYQELYKSDYLDSSVVTIEDINDEPLRIDIYLYYHDDTGYMYLNDASASLYLINSVLDSTEDISTSSSGVSNGYIRFYKEMLEADSVLSVVIDKNQETEQESTIYFDDYDSENSYSDALDNGITVRVSYWGGGVYQIEVAAEDGYDSNLNTVELTVTDKYGNEQIFTIERN